jgi:hypothetical protein
MGAILFAVSLLDHKLLIFFLHLFRPVRVKEGIWLKSNSNQKGIWRNFMVDV